MVVQSEPNAYSQRWFTFFHVPIRDARTIAEVDFVCSFAPVPHFRRIADMCCGMGRHARELAKRGYLVTGIERDLNAVAKARELGGGPQYIQADLRNYQPEETAHDVIIIMGQSFGHFEAATNRAVLKRLASGVRKHGRMVLDVWNPDFFESHQRERDFRLPDGIVHERKHVQGGRLFVQLTYPGGESEHFEWQLFTREHMEAMASSLSLTLVACCTDFGYLAEPCASQPRIQFVLERSA
jgi:SAM-dependent methyltransferase